MPVIPELGRKRQKNQEVKSSATYWLQSQSLAWATGDPVALCTWVYMPKVSHCHQSLSTLLWDRVSPSLELIPPTLLTIGVHSVPCFTQFLGRNSSSHITSCATFPDPRPDLKTSKSCQVPWEDARALPRALSQAEASSVRSWFPGSLEHRTRGLVVGEVCAVCPEAQCSGG